MANAIRAALSDAEVILRQDKKHVPYGLRQPGEILELVTPIFQELVDEDCQVIVVACNTVTTTLIGQLRERFSLPLVAIEPMVKPAAKLTKTGVIAVCATPTTLASPRYAELKQEFAKDITVLEPDCSDWAYMIEHKQVDEKHIEERIAGVLEKNADVIVLACTHYNWIENKIKEVAADKAQVIQPEQAIIDQLKRVLARLS